MSISISTVPIESRLDKTHRPQTPKLGTTQHKLHRIKQVTFSTAIPPNDAIHFWREGVDFRLLFEGAEVGEGY